MITPWLDQSLSLFPRKVQINGVNNTPKPVFKMLKKELFLKSLRAFSTHAFLSTRNQLFTHSVNTRWPGGRDSRLRHPGSFPVAPTHARPTLENGRNPVPRRRVRNPHCSGKEAVTQGTRVPQQQMENL